MWKAMESTLKRRVNAPDRSYKFIPLEFPISSVVNFSDRADIGSHELGGLIDFTM